jgi:hypothetical protein
MGQVKPGALRVMIAVAGLLLSGTVHGQGFTSSPISTGQVPGLSSISLAVSPINGLSYCAYTIGYPDAGEIFYGTRPEGGSWTTEDVQVYAHEVALTTTPFTQGNVVPHLALAGFYKPGPPAVEGQIMWATRSLNGTWTYETVEPSVGDGRYVNSPSITLDVNKVPHIAYWLSGGYYGISYLKLATRVGPNNWTIEVVDSAADFYDNVTVGIAGSDVVTFSRFRSAVGTYEFLYAHRSGSTWATEEIEPTASNPQNGATTTLPNGITEAVYLTAPDGMLNYAYRLGSNNWVRTKLRPTLDYNVHRGMAIVAGPDNYPNIAYYSTNGDSVRYASQSKFGWNYQQAAPTSGPWQPLSIGIHAANPDKPKIAYVGVEGIQYELADGTKTIHGNSSAAPALPDPPSTSIDGSIRTSIAVVGGPLTSARSVTLSIAHPTAEAVDLAMVDVGGRLVARRALESLAAGRQEVTWDLGSLPSGMYFVRMRTGSGAQASARCVIVR